jgi:hypothetical protein
MLRGRRRRGALPLSDQEGTDALGFRGKPLGGQVGFESLRGVQVGAL